MKKTHLQLIDLAVQHTKYRYVNLAKLLGCSKQSLSQMRKLNRVPEKYWNKFEHITNGKVKERHFK
jgi:hypothetical protein